MKNSRQFLLLICMFAFSFSLLGQIKGNGNREIRAFDFKNIEVLDFQVTVNAEIDLSATNELYVEVDENLFDHMTIKMKGNRLVIDQNEWIQPTESIKLILSAEGVKKIRNTAWGNILIKNMDQKEFEANMNVGTLKLEGKVDYLKAQTGAGKIDASKLSTTKANATIQENGQIIINAEEITYKGHGYGKLVYLGNPELKIASSDASELQIVTFEEELANRQNAKAVAFVEVKIKNNSSKRKQIRFRGPVEKPFGYGAPIGAKAVKSETFPVGTRVYQINPLGKDKLLLTIKAQDEGQVLKLYADNK